MKKLSIAVVREHIILCLMIALIFLFSSGVFAADGDKFSAYVTDSDQVRIGKTGKLIGFKKDIEVATTNDTVTASESGKTFLVNNGSELVTMTLLTSASGLEYTFTTINGNADGTSKVILNPQSTDTFVGCVNSTVTTTFVAGDDLDSSGATGDSVTIVGADTKWYCVDRTGTFADGN